MKIGIDGRAFQGNLTGIGKYVSELCRVLDRCLPDARFYIYSQLPICMPVNSKRWIHRQDPSILAKYMKSVLWLKLSCGRLCSQDDLDAFWSIGHFSPRLSKKIKRILIVHDVIFRVLPESMPLFHLSSHKLFFKKEVNRANLIITNSMGTSERLNQYYGRNADIIINPPVSKSFYPRSRQQIQKFLKKYNISSPYLLSVAKKAPIKNLQMLIRVYIKMKKEGSLPKHNLVLVGGDGWRYKGTHSLLSRNENNGIIDLGYIPENELPILYSGSDIFIFPSIYEGFGIPVLEARMCGARIVTSDIPELHEAGGDNAIYIVPSEEGIKKGILECINNKSDINCNKQIHHSAEAKAIELARAFKDLVKEL